MRPIIESYSLAATEEEFNRRLQKPRAFAREVGAGLSEYLIRALSHQAAITEPKDLAWLLASYARDGLARVEPAPRYAVAEFDQVCTGRIARRAVREGARYAIFPFDTRADAVLRHILRVGAMVSGGWSTNGEF